jgi:hypothetical protein
MQMKEIVSRYMDQQGMTLRGFAEALSERLPGEEIGHSTVVNWREGKTAPTTDFLVTVLMRYRDWRFDFALECLAEKRPEVWGPQGEIWQAVRDIAG